MKHHPTPVLVVADVERIAAALTEARAELRDREASIEFLNRCYSRRTEEAARECEGRILAERQLAEVNARIAEDNEYDRSRHDAYALMGGYDDELAKAIAGNGQLREALTSIAGFGDMNLAGEWEPALRDIIRSMTDCAKRALAEALAATTEEQRKVEGFGDPQYTCSETELAIRVAIYTFLQQKKAAGELEDLTMSQDWSGNTLHLKGSIRPRDLARAVADAVASLKQPS